MAVSNIEWFSFRVLRPHCNLCTSYILVRVLVFLTCFAQDLTPQCLANIAVAFAPWQQPADAVQDGGGHSAGILQRCGTRVSTWDFFGTTRWPPVIFEARQNLPDRELFEAISRQPEEVRQNDGPSILQHFTVRARLVTLV